jgi:uncharacterized membrane protein
MTHTNPNPLEHAAAPKPGGLSPHTPRWLVPATLLASVAGLGASVYLTVAHYTTAVVLACPATATVNCQKVTTSAQSQILGIPVAVLGLAYYTLMLALNLPPAWKSPQPWLRRARVLTAAGGIGFVAWLVYAELFIINAICLWCTTVHVITLALFCLVALGTAATSQANPAVAGRMGGTSTAPALTRDRRKTGGFIRKTPPRSRGW